MKMYTVSDVAKMSGTSVRTLHHYHEVDLLKPAHIGENGYRYYGKSELRRLQQILFYREFGVSLTDIAAFLDQPDFDHVNALRAHRTRLEKEIRRRRQLVRTIDRTIADIEGSNTMDNSELYKGFSPKKQAEYERELISKHGEEMRQNIEISKKAMADRSEVDQQKMMVDLQAIETGLANQMKSGTPPDSELLNGLLSRHQQWVGQMWGQDCCGDAYAGLADTYLSHPDFRKRYEAIAPGFTDYLTTAIKEYAAKQ